MRNAKSSSFADRKQDMEEEEILSFILVYGETDLEKILLL